MLEYLLYAIIVALAGYRRSVREGHRHLRRARRKGTDRYKQAQKSIDYQALP